MTNPFPTNTASPASTNHRQDTLHKPAKPSGLRPVSACTTHDSKSLQKPPPFPATPLRHASSYSRPAFVPSTPTPSRFGFNSSRPTPFQDNVMRTPPSAHKITPALTIRERLEQQYAKSMAPLMGSKRPPVNNATAVIGLGGPQYIPMHTPKKQGPATPTGTPIAIPGSATRPTGNMAPPLNLTHGISSRWEIFNAPSKSPLLNNKVELLKLLQDVIPEDMIQEFEKTPWSQPKELKSTMLPHQIMGVRWMMETEKRINGGILADDMGLGKTIQAICLIIAQRNPSLTSLPQKPTLVIAPVSLLDQWKSEIREHAGSSLSVIVHNGPKRATDPKDLMSYDVVISNYELVGGKRESNQVLFDIEFQRIILDEGHRIRNPTTKQTKACMDLRATYRWILTGTPIQNNVNEIFSYMQFLKCPAYKTKAQWAHHFDKSSDPKTSQARLHELLKRYLLRRTKDLISLPPKLIVCETLELSQGERVFYDKVQAVVAKGAKQAMLEKGGAMVYLALLMRLRQAVLHPDLVKSKNKPEVDWAVEEEDDENNVVADMSTMFGDLSLDLSLDRPDAYVPKIINDPVTPLRTGARTVQESPHVQVPLGRARFSYESTKVLRTLKILQSPHRLAAHLKSPKTIIFSQFTSMLAILVTALRDNRIDYCIYEGSMNQKQRMEALHRFKTDANVQVLLISLHCGSVGLNLTCASRIILFDPWWNPQIEFQAMDRVHRLGQKNPVVVHKLKVDNSVEERIFLLQEKKQAVAEQALGDVERDGSFKIPSNMRLSNDELMNLVLG